MATAESRFEEFSVQSFLPYEKMSTSTKLWESKRLDGIKNWVAMEKIHGANFSFSVLCTGHELARTRKSRSKVESGAETVLVAKRGGYLREGEVFFGVQTQGEFLEGEKEKARHVCEAVREKVDSQSEQVDSVTVFGELFGGYYPHPLVSPRPGVTHVQREVVYCPDLKFCAFDIAFTTSLQQDRRYLDYDVCMELFKQSGFLYAEQLATGSLQAMISYPLGFESKLPAKFGLPPLDKPNVAEGIVIKPMKETILETRKGPKRVIFKRKVEGFAEVKHRSHEHVANGYKTSAEGGTVWTPPDSDTQDYELMRYEMLALVTTQRVVNVISKLGRPSIYVTNLSRKGQKDLTEMSQTLSKSFEAVAITKKKSVFEYQVEWKDIVRGW